MKIPKAEARRFVLLKQGLLGPARFTGKQGALAYVRQAGCIQFDPVDVCGKMAELTLQSRVKGFRKEHLAALLYTDRALFDYPDKQLSILPVEDWPYFSRYREAARKSGEQFPELEALEKQALAYIESHGPVSARELPMEGSIYWHSGIHWSGNWAGVSDAARAALEQLYSTGELIIHHKEGTRKFYDLSRRHIPGEILTAPDPLPSEYAYQKWRVLRRIGAAGLLWDRASGYWNNIWGLNAENRHRIFRELTEEGQLTEQEVEGFKAPFYCLTEDLPLLVRAASGERHRPVCRLLAPLDPLLWDKELIRQLFDYDYTWEIYTPDNKRKFGAYVLPLLYGERFAGRVESVHDRKAHTLIIRHTWYEPDIQRTKALASALEKCMMKFAAFHDCEKVVWPEEIKFTGEGMPTPPG